jgi:hypothetical protein
MITVQVDGLEDAIKAFQKLGSVGEKYAMLALNETALESVSVMKKKAPVVTNRLRSSLHFETATTRSFVFKDRLGRTYSGSFNEKANRLEVIMGTNVEYADSVNENARSESNRGFFEAGVKHANDILGKRMLVNYNKAIDEIMK